MQTVQQTIGFAVMPRLNAPLVDAETGLITRPWQRLLIALYQKSGSGTANIPNVAYLEQDSNGVGVYNALTGSFLGYLLLSNQIGGAPVTLNLVTSPFVFSPNASGLLTIPGGELEISRNGSAYNLVGLTGGPLRLLLKDSARVTWFGAGPPAPVVWWPDQ